MSVSESTYNHNISSVDSLFDIFKKDLSLMLRQAFSKEKDKSIVSAGNINKISRVVSSEHKRIIPSIFVQEDKNTIDSNNDNNEIGESCENNESKIAQRSVQVLKQILLNLKNADIEKYNRIISLPLFVNQNTPEDTKIINQIKKKYQARYPDLDKELNLTEYELKNPDAFLAVYFWIEEIYLYNSSMNKMLQKIIKHKTKDKLLLESVHDATMMLGINSLDTQMEDIAKIVSNHLKKIKKGKINDFVKEINEYIHLSDPVLYFTKIINEDLLNPNQMRDRLSVKLAEGYSNNY